MIADKKFWIIEVLFLLIAGAMISDQYIWKIIPAGMSTLMAPAFLGAAIALLPSRIMSDRQFRRSLVKEQLDKVYAPLKSIISHDGKENPPFDFVGKKDLKQISEIATNHRHLASEPLVKTLDCFNGALKTEVDPDIYDSLKENDDFELDPDTAEYITEMQTFLELSKIVEKEHNALEKEWRSYL